MSKYVIYSVTNKNPEEPIVFWNNDIGWVNLDDATIFTEQEKKNYNPPIFGNWIEYPEKPGSLAILSKENIIIPTIVPKDDPYIDLTFHKEGKVMNVHIKLDDEGMVVDVYDETGGNFLPEVVTTTFAFYADFGSPQ